jgi:hypothetical protein
MRILESEIRIIPHKSAPGQINAASGGLRVF